MRPNANSRRSRGRGGRKSGNPRNQTFDSNGPGARVRGNASQIYEKYQQLARDAASSGDRVGAENFLQHAEHYYRMMSANGARPDQRNSDDRGADERGGNEGARANETPKEASAKESAAKPDTGDADDRAELDEALGAKRGKGNGANGRRRRQASRGDDADSGDDPPAGGEDTSDEGEAAPA